MEEGPIPDDPDLLQPVLVPFGREQVHLAVGRERAGQREPIADDFPLQFGQDEDDGRDDGGENPGDLLAVAVAGRSKPVSTAT